MPSVKATKKTTRGAGQIIPDQYEDWGKRLTNEEVFALGTEVPPLLSIALPNKAKGTGLSKPCPIKHIFSNRPAEKGVTPELMLQYVSDRDGRVIGKMISPDNCYIFINEAPKTYQELLEEISSLKEERDEALGKCEEYHTKYRQEKEKRKALEVMIHHKQQPSSSTNVYLKR